MQPVAYWITVKGCPSLTLCHSLMRTWWMAREGPLMFCKQKYTFYLEDNFSIVCLFLSALQQLLRH